MRLSRIICFLLSMAFSETRIFYPPFPPPGQYHETPTPPPSIPVTAYPHLQNQYIMGHNQRDPLYTLIQLYLHRLRFPQYHPPVHSQPVVGGQQAVLTPSALPNQPEGGALVEAAANPEGGTEVEVTETPPGGAVQGLIVGGSLGLPDPVSNPLPPQGIPVPPNGNPLPSHGILPPPPIIRPTIYNLQNNVPNNPIRIGPIRNRFYEQLCFQPKPTTMSILHAFPSFHRPLVAADTADPPACSCIPFNDCESASHRVINEATKSECGSALTGFACCCEEPPILGK